MSRSVRAETRSRAKDDGKRGMQNIDKKKKIKDHHHHHHHHHRHHMNGTNNKEHYADKENTLLRKNHRESSLGVSEDTNSRFSSTCDDSNFTENLGFSEDSNSQESDPIPAKKQRTSE
ncbi:hypothetical protein V9T40_014364 [Parthenolecanium corni]|uniref:Uncharacterized protein n=1 Tax=Parthenolecanium corni TaxID=536013 RepID=A0AAN9THK6_9HEMI